MRAVQGAGAAALVVAAVVATSAVAVARESSGPDRLGRIAYADGALTLDSGDGSGQVIEVGAAGTVVDNAPGWDTTDVPLGALAGDTVRWSLTGVDGPGDVRVYGEGEVPVGQQGDARWEFTEPGVYRVIFSADAVAARDGRELSVGTVYTVRVGGAAEIPAQTPSPAPAPAAEQRRMLTAVRPPAVAAAADDAVSTPATLTEGHLDFAARVVGGRLQLHVKDGTTAGQTVWREPSSLLLKVGDKARNTLPEGGQFAFLGKPGDPVWLLDQVQQEGLLWPGWSTDNVAAGALTGGVDFALTKAEGPGSFALYSYDAMSGATVLFHSKDGVPDSFTVPANTHAHGGWAFTAEGTYRLTFRMSGKLADGTATSDTETVTFQVGNARGSGGDGDGKGGTGSGGGTASPSPGATGGPSGGGSGTGGTGDTGATGGTGGTGGSSGPTGSMARTGAGDPLLVGTVAAGLAAVGGGAVWGVRRRRGRTA
ncbi:choice-of-anchor M domain-containing protein [Streptomyces sp. NPDC018693]|uniref:choice-of-anchor M domain-containing protein n=1 Tax=unclassified Streptomyces TaxID=2593676 RepID=UPI0037A1F5FC